MRMLSPRLFAAAALAASLFAASVQAENINMNSDNVALEGYDPVAYFTQSRPVAGVPDFQTEWQDATWQFSSAEHQAMFEENPEKYAPRFGGYCAGAMFAKGHKAPIDPQHWMIVDGKLFLGGQPMGFFAENRDEKINTANENWTKLVGTN